MNEWDCDKWNALFPNGIPNGNFLGFFVNGKRPLFLWCSSSLENYCFKVCFDDHFIDEDSDSAGLGSRCHILSNLRYYMYFCILVVTTP